jgi:hypothetical protein
MDSDAARATQRGRFARCPSAAPLPSAPQPEPPRRREVGGRTDLPRSSSQLVGRSPQSRTFAELLTRLRRGPDAAAVLVGMLREGKRR